MNKLIALIYWVFKADKKQTAPYYSTCLMTGLLFIINIASLLLFIGVKSIYFFNLLENRRLNGWANTFIIVTSVLLLFTLLFPKKTLDKYKFTDRQLKTGRRNLILFFVISLTILVILLIKSGIDRGFIK